MKCFVQLIKGKINMLWKDLLLIKFENGFRILSNKEPDDKFFIIDEVELKIGEVYRIGPNGYFERIEDAMG
jgi:hypothetical protein